MSTAVRRFPRFADVLERVGHVPATRIFTDPTPGTATEADLLDEGITGGLRCELIDGILVEKVMGVREGYLGIWIGHLLLVYLQDHNLGAVIGADSPIRFRLGSVRLPDVSFVRWDSLNDPDDIEDADGAFLDVPPDLAIEVLSPSNTRQEMAIKLDEYAAAGIKLVWYVDPDAKEVTVYPKGKERGKKVVGVDGVLDGGSVLPGFTLPVAKIFEKRAPAKKAVKKRRG